MRLKAPPSPRLCLMPAIFALAGPQAFAGTQTFFGSGDSQQIGNDANYPMEINADGFRFTDGVLNIGATLNDLTDDNYLEPPNLLTNSQTGLLGSDPLTISFELDPNSAGLNAGQGFGIIVFLDGGIGAAETIQFGVQGDVDFDGPANEPVGLIVTVFGVDILFYGTNDNEDLTGTCSKIELSRTGDVWSIAGTEGVPGGFFFFDVLAGGEFPALQISPPMGELTSLDLFGAGDFTGATFSSNQVVTRVGMYAYDGAQAEPGAPGPSAVPEGAMRFKRVTLISDNIPQINPAVAEAAIGRGSSDCPGVDPPPNAAIGWEFYR